MSRMDHGSSKRARSFSRRASLVRGVHVATGTGALFLAACNLPGTDSAPASRPAPTTLEFWGGPNVASRRDQVATWNETHPNVQVRFQADSAVGQGTKALLTLVAAIAAHTAPDVLDFDRFQVASCTNWRVFRALDDLLKRDRYDLKRFVPVALTEAYGFDGHLYGLPSSVDNRLLFWNKTSFREAGLDPDAAPASWATLMDAATRLVVGDGTGSHDRLGLEVGGGQATLHLFAWQNGGGFQSADGKSVTLPIAANVAALQWMIDLVRVQGGWPAIRQHRARWANDAGAGHPFLTGELAIQYELPNWAGDTLARYQPAMDFGVAAPPPRQTGGTTLTWSGGYSYVMGRETKAADASWELVRWLVDEASWRAAFDGERLRARAAGGSYLPSMTGQPALDARLLEVYRTGVPALDAVPDLALQLITRSRVRERSIAAADLWDSIIQAQTAALSGQEAPLPALERNNALVQRALDQAWVFAPQRASGNG